MDILSQELILSWLRIFLFRQAGTVQSPTMTG
jgi:hypothetical protein